MQNNILKTALVKWEELKPFQPQELKKMSKVQLDNIKTSFKNNGFKSPFYVWEDKETLWVLDGHQRLPILKLLRDEGEAVPDKLPANFVFCKNKKEAKKAVLIYNSHYADIQQDILADWIKDLDFDDIKFGKIFRILISVRSNNCFNRRPIMMMTFPKILSR
jgi:ParB-like chromosome segregation protein Spo0J